MTQEEHNLLILNNKMLKLIIQYINIKESTNSLQANSLQKFVINVLANQIK